MMFLLKIMILIDTMQMHRRLLIVELRWYTGVEATYTTRLRRLISLQLINEQRKSDVKSNKDRITCECLHFPSVCERKEKYWEKFVRFSIQRLVWFVTIIAGWYLHFSLNFP